ncbi:MAG: hypothetical protein ACI85O_003016, partial [Saprospiraceae bacterium]
LKKILHSQRYGSIFLRKIAEKEPFKSVDYLRRPT